MSHDFRTPDSERICMITRILSFFVVLAAAGLTHSAAPSEGQYGLIRTLSAKTIGRAAMDIGVGVTYGQDASYMQKAYEISSSGDTILYQ